jgi:DNA-binding MarR family transcriptional regulator/GNAT superfamily N-acetyltransferase
MTSDSRLEPQITEQISAVREFNRFYTSRLRLLSRRHLDTRFSLTEARVLYELNANPQMTASMLRDSLELDAGYISRLLAALVKKKLVRRASSKSDGREKHLILTGKGERAVARLNEQSSMQLEEMLMHVNSADRQLLLASLENVRQILGGKVSPTIRIERLRSPNDDAIAILQEYYDAVHVVQRDKPGSLQKTMEEPGSGMWLAYRGKNLVGCVVLRRLASIPLASECKRLYVTPAARGNRIADKLLDVQEEFARSQGVEWIYLDSYDDLKVAVALYERRGFQHCERYNDNPQATLFMRKRIS